MDQSTCLPLTVDRTLAHFRHLSAQLLRQERPSVGGAHDRRAGPIESMTIHVDHLLSQTVRRLQIRHARTEIAHGKTPEMNEAGDLELLHGRGPAVYPRN